MLGYHPQVILAGRRINDGMGKFIAEKTVKLMIQSGIGIKGAVVNVLGLTFKEDCPDLRNSKVPDIITELRSYGIRVHVFDPIADADEAMHEYGIELAPLENLPRADGLLVAVAHRAVAGRMPAELQALVRDGGTVIDVKSCLSARDFQNAGYRFWRL
jgi:UDP-N-acetyl-D-galactosamine dehydrogenase